MKQGIKCRICGYEAHDYLGDHLLEDHGLTAAEYLDKYPGAPTLSKRLSTLFSDRQKKVRRTGPPKPQDLTVKFRGVPLKVNTSVPRSACLPRPAHYHEPKHGEIADDAMHVTLAFADDESPPIFIHGEPGGGKDALIHELSNLTLTPGIRRSIVPGTDIQSWFFYRDFDADGTRWVEGPVLLALRDGFTCPDGTVVPYLFLISDFDRADRSQAEYLRLITDTIDGNVVGPHGVCFPIYEGTTVIATANSAGGGDVRGRYISSNPIDASILDRFLVAVHFHQLAWEDEEHIVRAKFPELCERVPGIVSVMGKITNALRKGIQNEDLYAEFSHRGVCAILKHAQRLVRMHDGVPDHLMKNAARIWVDKLSDEDSRKTAWHLMDDHIKGGFVDAGDTSHIQTDTQSLVQGFGRNQ